jgi:ABC-type transport system involved in cytochrome c biogenesis permease subunit
MNQKLTRVFAVIGVIAVSFLLIAVLTTAQVGLGKMFETFWVAFCHVVLVFLTVAIFMGGLMASIFILTKKTPESGSFFWISEDFSVYQTVKIAVRNLNLLVVGCFDCDWVAAFVVGVPKYYK